MGCSLNSLKRGYLGDYIGDDYRDYKGDTTSLDYSSCRVEAWGSRVRVQGLRLLGEA